MKFLELKYGNNPHQKPASINLANGADLPITVRNGQPGYINLLDALNAWQLVRELREATGMACATSFKHVSPTAAAVGKPLSRELKKAAFCDDLRAVDESELAAAYARARGADRLCSYGDFVALSDVCDLATAKLIQREVSDGVIAPGYDPQALKILQSKRGGKYTVLEIDPEYEPDLAEVKTVFGISFHQRRNDLKIDESLLQNIVTKRKDLPAEAKLDLLVGLITLKYTQSNSVCFSYDGQAIGVGAGQQSRIHCTRLAGDKADTWFFRQHPLVLNLPFKDGLRRADRDNAIDGYINQNELNITADGIWQRYFTKQPAPFTSAEKAAYLSDIKNVSLSSDAFFPFADNIQRAAKSGVSYIAQPGGSIRDDAVIAECDAHEMIMICHGKRLFHH